MNIIKILSMLRVCSFEEIAKELEITPRTVLSKSRGELKLTALQFHRLFKLIEREKVESEVFRSYLRGMRVDQISFASLFEAGLL